MPAASGSRPAWTRRPALYRSLLAGRRVLVVLDNARDAEQVRPLLPGSPGCLVVVTSRNQLTGLVAAEGAQPVTARPAHRRRGPASCWPAGSARTGSAAEPDAVDEIIDALRPAAAGAGHRRRPGRDPPALPAGRRSPASCATGRRAWTPSHGGDPATDVRAVFSWSYQALDRRPAARLFRLLGLHPGPDIAGAPRRPAWPASPPAQAAHRAAELTRAHLLTEHAPGRYAFHDLLRAYAAELAQADDSARPTAQAARRLLDHYLHTAHAAALRSRSATVDQLDLPAPRRACGRSSRPTSQQALAWLTAEHRVLLAAIDLAAATGHDGHRLAPGLGAERLLPPAAHWPDWAATQRIALDSARRAEDHVGLAHAHQGLGRAYTWLGRHDEAERELARPWTGSAAWPTRPAWARCSSTSAACGTSAATTPRRCAMPPRR